MDDPELGDVKKKAETKYTNLIKKLPEEETLMRKNHIESMKKKIRTALKDKNLKEAQAIIDSTRDKIPVLGLSKSEKSLEEVLLKAENKIHSSKSKTSCKSQIQSESDVANIPIEKNSNEKISKSASAQPSKCSIDLKPLENENAKSETENVSNSGEEKQCGSGSLSEQDKKISSNVKLPSKIEAAEIEELDQDSNKSFEDLKVKGEKIVFRTCIDINHIKAIINF